MKVFINPSFPISIKEQIKTQIVFMIEAGELIPGDQLLSAEQLAIQLKINRNTVALVYKELEKKGVLKIVKGSGTFVAHTSHTSGINHLTAIFDQAYELAIQSDFSPNQIIRAFLSGLLKKSIAHPPSTRAILVDCNYDVLNDLNRRLKQNCRVESHFVLIQDILNMPEKFIKRANEYDHIVCGMSHMAELKQAAPGVADKTLAFMLRFDLSMLHEIMSLPDALHIGYCCVNKQAAKAFSHPLDSSRQTNTPPVIASVHDHHAVKLMMKTCDIVYASHYAYNHLSENFPANEKIRKVKLEIDQESLNFITTKFNKKQEDNG